MDPIEAELLEMFGEDPSNVPTTAKNEQQTNEAPVIVDTKPSEVKIGDDDTSSSKSAEAGSPSQAEIKSENQTTEFQELIENIKEESSASTDDTDDDESNEDDGETFLINGNVHRRHHVSCVPNQFSKVVYSKLRPDVKKELREMAVAMFFEKRGDYEWMNEKLKRLYGKHNQKWVCLVCFHFGLRIANFTGEKDPIHEFTSSHRWGTHYDNYHFRQVQCIICNLFFDNTKAHKGHLKAMEVRPNAQHKKYKKDPQKAKPRKNKRKRNETDDESEEDECETLQGKKPKQLWRR